MCSHLCALRRIIAQSLFLSCRRNLKNFGHASRASTRQYLTRVKSRTCSLAQNHVQDTRAMETLFAHLSHLLRFKMEHSCFFVGIPYLETRTVECKTIFRVARSNKNHVSTEARHGSVSASDNCCHHFDRKFTIISWPTTILSKR